ncbi:MAG: TatD family hydrolase [Armatimonadota bacterium]
MIDAHCHLNDPRLLPQVDELLARMLDAGVAGALVVGYDVPSSRQAVELARRHPALRAAVAVHPHESKDLDAAGLAALAELGRQPEVVAFGEIGLDFHYDHSPRDVQREAFTRQLALAAELGLPVVIHEREAAEETMAILDAEDGWARGGEWHCCSTTPELAARIATRFYIGIAGWLTFPKAENIREMARAVPLERMVVETDAPYLAPVPHRGRTNEPAYVPIILQALAALKGLPVEDVERITDENVQRVFPRWN